MGGQINNSVAVSEDWDILSLEKPTPPQKKGNMNETIRYSTERSKDFELLHMLFGCDRGSIELNLPPGRGSKCGAAPVHVKAVCALSPGCGNTENPPYPTLRAPTLQTRTQSSVTSVSHQRRRALQQVQVRRLFRRRVRRSTLHPPLP